VLPHEASSKEKAVLAIHPLPFWVGTRSSERRILAFSRNGGNFMFGLGMPELVVILVIILIIFGAGKLPEIGSGIGRGIKNFKKATDEDKEKIASPEEKKTDSGEKS
jgi:sec-independent protein translocase protein TatA